MITNMPFDKENSEQKLKNTHSHHLLYQYTQEKKRPRYLES